jgi:hypothetical protein
MPEANLAHLFLHLFGAAELHQSSAARIGFIQAFLHLALRCQIDVRADFFGQLPLHASAADDIAEEGSDTHGQRRDGLFVAQRDDGID